MKSRLIIFQNYNVFFILQNFHKRKTSIILKNNKFETNGKLYKEVL